MMMMTLVVGAILLQQPSGGAISVGQPQAIGAQQRTPPRDNTEKKGTAIIRGKILNGEGRPLRRVQLRVTGEALSDSRTASTNGLGQFEIGELPAGRYTLNATRAGYLNMTFGQTRPGEPG